MEREVGGGIGMGNTCKPMADSFQCMTKSTTIKKRKKEKNNKSPGFLWKLPFLTLSSGSLNDGSLVIRPTSGDLTQRGLIRTL